MPELIISEISPSILVTEKISGASGRLYSRRNIEEVDSEGKKTQHWEVVLITDTSPELRELQRLKLLAYSRIRRVCTQTPAGLICPEFRREELETTIREMREKARQFNLSSQSSSLSLRYSLFDVPIDSKTVIGAIAEQIASTADFILGYLQSPSIAILSKAQSGLLAGGTVEEILLRDPLERDRIVAHALAHLIRHELLSIRGIDGIFIGEASVLASRLVREAREIASKAVRGTGRREPLESILGSLNLESLKEIVELFDKASNKADEESGYGSLNLAESLLSVEIATVSPAVSSLLDMPFEELKEEIEELTSWDAAVINQIFNPED